MALLPRLLSEAAGEAPSPGPVQWEILGEMRPGPAGASPEPWMHMRAGTKLPLTCQRCLGPVETDLEVDRWFRFVADEAAAEAQDDDCEEDLLALEPRPNLYEVLEDELLMALPLVPVHGICPVQWPMQARDPAVPDEEGSGRPNPFAVLQKLKK
ncbi:DUF177 domain-containing protein [Hydrogenophaga sp.]|uniref:YceD family protein n=1 Tax=Hydrogenophaga sp. TaxID=1904254 RepID=UPI00260ECE3E|nr:DUF177 domain-containing protein [Hydrogenophaga sp.]